VAEFKVFYDNLHPAELKVCERCFFFVSLVISGSCISSEVRGSREGQSGESTVTASFFFAECENFRKLVNHITNHITQSVISIMPVLSRILYLDLFQIIYP
jgi:hypothetical protein